MNTVRDIFLNNVEVILLLLVFSAVCNQKRFILDNKLKTIILCIIYTIVNYGSNFILVGYRTVFLSIFYILIISYFTKISISSSMAVYFIFFSIVLFTELSFVFIAILITGKSMEQIIAYSSYGWMFSKLLQVILITILFKYSKIFTRFNLLQKEGTIISNFIVQTGVFGLLILSVTASTFNSEDGLKYSTMIFCVYFIFIFLGIKDLKDREQLINIYSNYKVQNGQIKNMEEIISIIRKEKHDFANHINVIKALCTMNKSDSLNKINNYVNKISNNLHESFIYVNTGNDYLDGLLSIKNNYATKNNVQFDIIIDQPFSDLNIKYDELISIVSNLVDNGFEILKKKTENKQLSINTFIQDECYCIEVANNGEPIPQNLMDKIFEKGFSTKKNQGDDHGYGLFIVKELIEKNNGKLFVESDEEETNFLIKFALEC